MFTSRAHLTFAPEPRGGFLSSVRRRAKVYFEDRGYAGGRTAPVSVWIKGTLFAVIASAAYAGIFLAQGVFWAQLGAYALFGLAALLLALNIGHDAAHGAFLRSQRANRWVNRGLFMLLGVDGRLWSMRHVHSHHVFANIRECDADIEHNPFLRLAPAHPWRPRHRWQHFYAPFIYMLTALHSILVQDIIYLFKRRLANMDDIRQRWGDVALFAAGKIVHFGLTPGLPIAFAVAPLWQILLAYLTMSAVISLTFILLLIGTHFAEGTDFPEPDADGRLPHCWSTHQMVTSLDWAPRSRVVNFLLGGLNAHAAHHLFPAVSHGHYRTLTAIIAEEAANHGVRYNATSLAGMLRGHFAFLKRMGAPPAGKGIQAAFGEEAVATTC